MKTKAIVLALVLLAAAAAQAGNWRMLARQGRQALWQGRYDQAIRLYSQAIQWHEPMPGLLLGRGLARVFKGTPQSLRAGIKDLETPIDMNFKAGRALAARAQAHYLLGDLPRALADARQAVRRSPNLHFAHRALAWILFKSHKPQAALQVINRAIELKPKAWGSYMIRGQIHLKLGSAAQARQDLATASQYLNRRGGRFKRPFFNKELANLRAQLASLAKKGPGASAPGAPQAAALKQKQARLAKEQARLAKEQARLAKEKERLAQEKAKLAAERQKMAAAQPAQRSLQKSLPRGPQGRMLMRPRLFVLAVGVSQYSNPRLRLKFAAKDATALAKVIKAQPQGIFEEVRVKLLVDQKVTRESVLAAMSKFFGMAISDDVAIIFMAGHGVKRADTGSYYYLPYGASDKDLLTKGLRWSDFEEAVSILRKRVNNLVLLLDTCHAGALQVGMRGSMAGQDLSAPFRRKGFYTLAAAQPHEGAQENPRWGHGAFTYAIIEGLGGKADLNRDQRVDVLELFKYVERRVPQLTEGSQHPRLFMGGGSLPVAMVPK